MPSGPKKRQAARRRKLREEEERHHHQEGHAHIAADRNGSDRDTASESFDEEDLSSSTATTPATTPTPNSHNRLSPGEREQHKDVDLSLKLDDRKQRQQQNDVEEWVQQSDFDVGTPPPQTPTKFHAMEEAEDDHHHQDCHDEEKPHPQLQNEEREGGHPSETTQEEPKDHPPTPAATSAVGDEVHKQQPQDSPQKVLQPRETASGCCGVIDWLMGRTA